VAPLEEKERSNSRQGEVQICVHIQRDDPEMKKRRLKGKSQQSTKRKTMCVAKNYCAPFAFVHAATSHIAKTIAPLVVSVEWILCKLGVNSLTHGASRQKANPYGVLSLST